MNEPIETIEHANCEINIEYDFDPISPRTDCDNLGTMYCWHNHYDLGDENPYSEPSDLEETFADNDVILVLYLYDHSGISMSYFSFIGRAQHAEWDSGPVGYYVIKADEIRAEYSCKRISKKTRASAIRVAENEIETYDSYLRGEIYGYVVEHNTSDEEESCWGIIGDFDYCMSEAKSMAEYLDKNHLETLAKQAEQSRLTKQSRVIQLLRAHVPLNTRSNIINQLT